MNQQRTIKVWNKTVTITNVPDYITDDELIEWTKKKLILDTMHRECGTAS
jgi:hypothetical protein